MRDISIVVGLSYGDEGKGSIVDYLARKTETSLVVRYNGGAQAAHNVITPEGLHHTFAQFGSGTFVPGSATYLSEYMLVNPLNLYTEGRHLIELGVPNVWDRLFISEHATIITPWQVKANQIREEQRGMSRHGSCGQGIGETVSDALNGLVILAKDLLLPPEEIKTLLTRIRDIKRAQIMSELGISLSITGGDGDEEETYLNRVVSLYGALPETVHIIDNEQARQLFSRPEQIIFEGAQGILLDQDYGWHPHTTWSNTTVENANTIINWFCQKEDKVTRIGVIRSYSTRHGEGPFPTENHQTGGVEAHNRKNPWQGDFRIGAFDAVMLDYALAVQDVDCLALTCVDQVGLGEQYVCVGYKIGEVQIQAIEHREVPDLNRQQVIGEMLKQAQPEYIFFQTLEQFINWLGSVRPILIASHGPAANEKTERNISEKIPA